MNIQDRMTHFKEQVKVYFQDRLGPFVVKHEDLYCWKNISECSEEEKEKSNLRTLFKSEVILDLEDPKKINQVKDFLEKEKLSFEIWNSNKGFHFHLFFLQLEHFEDWQRKLAREFYIKKTNTDLSKRSGVIAQEEKPHFKSGRIKKLIEKVDNGINCLSPECLAYLQQNRPLHSISQTSQIKDCRLIDYALKNKLNENTGRGSILAKNMTIFFLNKKVNARDWLNKFYAVQGINNGSDWTNWAKEHNNFSCKELRWWLRQTQKSFVEELTCWKCQKERCLEYDNVKRSS